MPKGWGGERESVCAFLFLVSDVTTPPYLLKKVTVAMQSYNLDCLNTLKNDPKAVKILQLNIILKCVDSGFLLLMYNINIPILACIITSSLFFVAFLLAPQVIICSQHRNTHAQSFVS